MDTKKCYEKLGLSENATQLEIEDRYTKICEVCMKSPSLSKMEELANITEAYKIISSRQKHKNFSLVRESRRGELKEKISRTGFLALKIVGVEGAVLISVTTIKHILDLNLNFSNVIQEEYVQEDASPTIDNADQEMADSYIQEDEKQSIYVIDGITYIDGILVVNKSYALPSDYVPANPNAPITKGNGIDFLDRTTMDAFKKMQKDAKEMGLNIWIASGFRSYDYQERLYNNYLKRGSQDVVDTYSARPGYSEHQTGLAFDLNSVTREFADTEEGKWIAENCHKYGFIIRYPEGKMDATGYMYEPWHLRYVGLELASKLYNDGDWLTIESVFGITSDYDVQPLQEKSISIG